MGSFWSLNLYVYIDLHYTEFSANISFTHTFYTWHFPLSSRTLVTGILDLCCCLKVIPIPHWFLIDYIISISYLPNLPSPCVLVNTQRCSNWYVLQSRPIQWVLCKFIFFFPVVVRRFALQSRAGQGHPAVLRYLSRGSIAGPQTSEQLMQ